MSSLLIISCSTQDQPMENEETNVLLKEWEGPYQGVPAFDKMKLEDLKPALEKAMAMQLEEIDAIVANEEAPDFENTIVAMERSGAALDRLFAYYGIWSSNISTPEFREIQAEMAPKLSEFFSKISQNEGLFAKVKAVYDASIETPLEADKQRVVDLVYEDFALSGADLDQEKKARYAEIQKELSSLHTNFANNVLADEEGYVTYLTEDQLGGLPESYVKAAQNAAGERGKEGAYAVTNTRSSMDPFLTYSTERDLREKVWKTYYARGNNGDKHDNNDNIKQIVSLRNERVALMGYDNYAKWKLQTRMAKNAENVMDMMMAVWPAAVSRVEKEVADMQGLAEEMGDKITIEPWDYRYYAEKVRKAKYDLNSDEVKQYMQLSNLREAMFFVANELFNLKFTPIEEGTVPVFHEDVTVYEVADNESGKLIGLFYLDPFARQGKRSGAWATTYRSHSSFDGEKLVLASNNSNFIKPAPGEPVLISWDDATTLFHEFGHALHYLSSKVTYPTLNGAVRDFIEFQSQVLERWLPTDKVIEKFLTHYETGEPMPAELVAKVKAAANFNQGFETTEYLASSLMDMFYHTTNPANLEDVQEFERYMLDSIGLPKEIVMRHRSTQFGHIFSGEGYSTGYYSYMWADVIVADAAKAFEEAEGGYYDKELAGRMYELLFEPGNTVDAAEAYRKFRGKDAQVDALIKDRGLMD